MANVFKYLTGNPSRKAIKRGNLARGIGNEEYGPTSKTGYYAGVNPPEGGYVVVIPRADNTPSFRIANSENELIIIANELGGNVNSIFEAKIYLSNQSNIWVLNNSPKNYTTNGLVLNVDASQPSSFAGKPHTTNLHPDPYLISPFTNGFTTVTNYDSHTEITSAGPWYGVYYRPWVEQGKIYTYSFWYKHISGATRAGGHTDYGANIRIDGGSWQGGNIISVPNDGEYHFIEIRFTAGNTGNTSIYLQPGRGNAETTTGQILTKKGFGVQFEEGGGATNFVDSTLPQNHTWNNLINNSTGNLYNSPTFNPNGYFEMDGADDIIYGWESTLGNGTTNCTLDMYVNITQASFWGQLFYIGVSNFNHNIPYVAFYTDIYDANNHKLVFGTNQTSDGNRGRHAVVTSIAPYLNEWVHIVGTMGDGKLEMFVNGVSMGTYTLPENWSCSLQYQKVYIGGGLSTGYVSDVECKIHSAKIYNRILSQTEILQNYNSYNSLNL